MACRASELMLLMWSAFAMIAEVCLPQPEGLGRRIERSGRALMMKTIFCSSLTFGGTLKSMSLSQSSSVTGGMMLFKLRLASMALRHFIQVLLLA